MSIRLDESDKEAGRLRQMRGEIRHGNAERYGVATVTVEVGEIGNAKMDVVNVYMVEGEYSKPVYRVDEERQTYSNYEDAMDRAKAKAETIEKNLMAEKDNKIKWEKNSDNRFFYTVKVSHPDMAFDSRYRIEVIGDSVEFIDYQAFGSDNKTRKTFDSNEEARKWAREKKQEITEELENEGWTN